MPSERPVIVLVHGAWHRSWCWKYQIPEFLALGYTVETLDLPCTSGVAGKTQFDDAAHVRAKLETLVAEGKRVVVLAHSYGGPIGCSAIIGLSERERAAEKLPGGVLGMVALCALILPGGLDGGAAIRSRGGLPYAIWDSPSEGLFNAKDPRSLFYLPDVPADRSDWAVSELLPQSMAANTGIVPPQAWQGETYNGRLGYIRCTADCLVAVARQDAMIEAAGGAEKWQIRTLEGSGHSPFLSRPDQVAATVDDLVRHFEAVSE